MREREQGGEVRSVTWRIRPSDDWVLSQGKRMAAVERGWCEDIAAVRSSRKGSASLDIGGMGMAEQVGGNGHVGAQGRVTIAAGAGAWHGQHHLLADGRCAFHISGREGQEQVKETCF